MRLTRRKLLVVDTDPATYRYLRRRLSCEGYDIAGLERPDLTPARAAEWHPDILLMATDLLTAEGALLIKAIKMVRSIPIIGLLPGSDPADAIEALNAGVDDCIAKPFSLKELAARLRKMLRQDMLQRGLKPSFTSGELQVDLVARRVRRDGHEFVLSDMQVKLLQLLMAADGGVVAQRDLLQGLWGVRGGNKVSALRGAIYSLRNKVEADSHKPRYILTEPHIGYRLTSPRRPPSPANPPCS
jgi:two-component system, OmpR family, KDP operon response regulator KdpE